MKANVRPAHGEDRDAIISLLQAGFGSPWAPNKWRPLFEYPGAENQPNLGFVLEAGNQIVGFLGAVYSERFIAGHRERFCNLSSWHVIPEFRSRSIELLVALLSQRGYTFVNLTPSERVTQVMRATGFQPLEAHKLLCGPWLYRTLVREKMEMSRNSHSYEARRLLEIPIETALLKTMDLMRGPSLANFDCYGAILLAGVEVVRPLLSRADQQLLDDHRQCGHFLVQDEESYSYIVTVKRKISFGRRSLVDFVVSDILHLSSPELALPHWESLTQFITGHEGSHAVSADERLFPHQRPEGLCVPSYAYFMSKNGISPALIDSLYSEIALLDLLIYV